MKYIASRCVIFLTLASLALAGCGRVAVTPTDAPVPAQPPTEIAPTLGPTSTPVPFPSSLEQRDPSSASKRDSLIYQDPATVDNSDLPITPVEELHTTGTPVELDINTYRLTVEGLVENPLSLS